ncbi:MAG: LptF/LptG family permease [Thermoguttaceae bacterium]|jgi:lipopolysaccharide export system permease protein
MRIIDRYLLRQFVQTFLICFLSFVGIVIVFDLFTNLDEFVAAGRAAGSVPRFIASFYLFQTIGLFDRVGGLLALVSAMFTVSWIQRNNEMTALMAAGVSRIRVLLPIIAAVAVVSLILAANREIVMPRFRHELSRGSKDPGGSKPQGLSWRYDGRTNVLLGGKNSFADQQRIEEPHFRMPPGLSTYSVELTADNAFYKLPCKSPQDVRPGGYLFKGVRRPKNLTARPSLSLDGQPVLLTPRDTSWLKADECFVVSEVDFDQLTGGTGLTQLCSTAELIRGLRNQSLDYGAKEKVAIHARIVQPLLDMTLLFLGLPLVVTRENRNVFVAMGICVVVTTVFTLVVMGVQNLGAISYWIFAFPPLAAWAPLMIFVPLAVWMAEGLWQ